MLDTIDTMQQFADSLKGLVLDMTGTSKATRLSILRTINQLEGCGWHPAAMQDAIQSAGYHLEFEGGLRIIDADSGKLIDTQLIPRAIERIASEYGKLIDCDAAILQDIFDASEAAEYLGIGKDMFYKYSSRQHRIRGIEKGGAMLYTRQQLDRFKREEMRGPGRPPVKDEQGS